MEQKYILGIIITLIVSILGISIASAFGFGKGFSFIKSNLTEEEKAEIQKQNQEIRNAIENGDFATWKYLMEERIAKMQSQLTEENFNTLREHHQKMMEFRKAMQEARESGDFSKVKELQEKYGFEHKGFKKGMKNCPFMQ